MSSGLLFPSLEHIVYKPVQFERYNLMKPDYLLKVIKNLTLLQQDMDVSDFLFRVYPTLQMIENICANKKDFEEILIETTKAINNLLQDLMEQFESDNDSTSSNIVILISIMELLYANHRAI